MGRWQERSQVKSIKHKEHILNNYIYVTTYQVHARFYVNTSSGSFFLPVMCCHLVTVFRRANSRWRNEKRPRRFDLHALLLPPLPLCPLRIVVMGRHRLLVLYFHWFTALSDESTAPCILGTF